MTGLLPRDGVGEGAPGGSPKAIARFFVYRAARSHRRIDAAGVPRWLGGCDLNTILQACRIKFSLQGQPYPLGFRIPKQLRPTRSAFRTDALPALLDVAQVLSADAELLRERFEREFFALARALHPQRGWRIDADCRAGSRPKGATAPARQRCLRASRGRVAENGPATVRIAPNVLQPLILVRF